MRAVSRMAIPIVIVAAAAALAYWLGGISAATGSRSDPVATPSPKRLAGATTSSGSAVLPYLRREIDSRDGRSFEGVLSHLRSTITSSGFSKPEIAASILMLRQLSAAEIAKLIGALDDEPLAGVSPPRRATIRGLLLEDWGRLDHEAALAYVSGQGVEHNRDKALHAVLSGWARSDPAAALAHVREFGANFPGGHMQSRPTTFEIYMHWARQDVGAVMDSLPSLGDDTSQRAALAGIGNLLRLPDRREEILGMIDQIPDEDLRGKAVLAAATSLEHAATAAWIEKMGDLPQESRKHIRRYLTDSWTQSDPRAASEWLLKTAQPSERAKVITDVVKWWAWADTNSAAEWVTGIGLSPETDGAVARLVQGFSQIDPQAGFAWAQRITSRDERVRQLANSLRFLQPENPEAAARHLAESGIADDEVAAVLERFARVGSGEPLLAE